MTGTDRTDWERIARQTLWQSLTTLGDEAHHTTEEIGDALYWGHDLDPEQVERLRQVAFDLRFATEEYLARLCADTDPWADAPDDRTPSFHPGELPADAGGKSQRSTANEASADASFAVDQTTDDPGD